MRDVPVAVVIPASAPELDEAAMAAALSLVPQAGAIAVILDARPIPTLTDQARYRLRTLATAARAALDISIGIQLLPSQISDPSIDSLAGYIDFVVLPADTPEGSMRLSSMPVWTEAASGMPPSAFDIVTRARLRGSDHVLVRLPSGHRDVVSAIRSMREVLPGGLAPLPDVLVTCDAACDAAVYLNPQTLDAVAIIRPRVPITRVTVSPAATDLDTFGQVQARGSDGRLDLPATAAPFVLQIRGWRRTTEEAFATGVEVTGSRELTVDEIVARHQAARARQERALQSLISTGSTVLTFQVPGFPGPLTVTARTTVFAGSGQTDIEQQQIRVNGLDLPRGAGDAPKLPLIEPERVTAPPLRITLTEAYTYTLSGRQRINGRDAYVVSFMPRDSEKTLFEGRAWIDTQMFVLLRTDAMQTALGGPVASSREIHEYEPSEQASVPVSLLQRAETFQVYAGPVGSTPIHRIVSFDRHEMNADDYASRLEAAHRSDSVVLRDTPQGYRFLVPHSTPGGEPRRLSTSNREHVTTAVVGSLFDPNISVPLVFAGVSYLDFNLLGTGTQLNAFFGGTYGRLSWATRPLVGGRWRLAGAATGLAVSYNDRAFRAGVEHYDENIRQRPVQASLGIVGTIAPAVRLRAGYELGYTRYTRAESTAVNFRVPASTPVHGARIAVEAGHGPWNATTWLAVARRQTWQPWGKTPSSTQLDAQVFERYGATLARSFVRSPRSVAHIEMAWMTGRRLDRFSQFTFGTFDNPLRGYPAVSIRYNSGAAVRSVATWTPTTRVRLDGFADLGIVRGVDDGQTRLYPGMGAAIEIPAPSGWLIAAEWGYGPRGVSANGKNGTHVVRITGYKMF
jgi:MucB/RseB N-terminal domain